MIAELESVSGTGASAPDPAGRLHVTESGTQGKTLVFLHGIGGTTRYWATRVAPLAHRFRIVLVDLLGFGKSPKPWIRYSVDRHVEELHRVLCAESPFILVGHSFGAVAAIAYAARYPDAVSGLVLMSVPSFGGVQNAIGYYRRVGGPDRWLMTNFVLAALTCIVTRRLFGRLLPHLLSGIPREVAEDLVQHTWLSSTSTIWDGVYRYDVAGDADRLRAKLPVCLVHGLKDTTAPPGFMLQLIDGRIGWKVHMLPDVDHHPLLRDPDRCLEFIEMLASTVENESSAVVQRSIS